MGFVGPPFTWTNRRHGPAEVLVQLDQAFGTQSLFQKFESTLVRHLCLGSSDHMAITIDMNHNPQVPQRRAKRFHFEEVWTTMEGC